MIITKDYLQAHPNEIFVFGDNLLRVGTGGAAFLRSEPNTYGFVTKRAPNNNPDSFYTSADYREVYEREVLLLKATIEKHIDKTFLISQIGAGLANKHWIWEEVIQPRIREDFGKYPNVKFLWEDKPFRT